MSQVGTSSTTPQNLGQEILNDLKTAWGDVETFGEEAVQELESFAQNEYNALKGAAVSVLGSFLPKQVALIQQWVAKYKQQAGTSASLIGAAEYCLAQDAAQEVAFLQGEMTVALQALSGAFLNSL